MGKIVAVDIQQLIIGRPLAFPIHDKNGVLLINGGSALTPELKKRLLARGVTSLMLDEVDAANTTFSGTSEKLLTKLADRLDGRIESAVSNGTFVIGNTGPALCCRLVRHGRKKIDPAHQAEVDRSAAELQTTVRDAFASDTAEAVEPAVNQALEFLTCDMASTLATLLAGNDDPSLEEHAINVAALSAAIAIELGFDEENVRTVYYSGLFADIGMMLVPRTIRQLPRKLSPIEFVEIEKHVIQGANRLEKMSGLPNVVQLIAYQVHERPDGSGYPRGREMQSIHPFARIVHVADAYLAMTSARPHRPPLMPYAAMECLLKQATKWRVAPEAVRGLLHVLSLFPIGSFVTLSDGSIAQVMRPNGEHYSRPVVLQLQAADGEIFDPDDDSRLIDLMNSDLTVVQALQTPGTDETPLTVQALNPACFERNYSFNSVVDLPPAPESKPGFTSRFG